MEKKRCSREVMKDRNSMSSLDAKLAHLRLPLEDIVIATKDFAEENLLKRGGKTDVYKGLLMRWSEPDIDVVIWRYSQVLDSHEGIDRSIRWSKELYFLEEIDKISDLRHRNVASLIGFCDEKGERMIVMEHVVNGSLDKYLNDPTLTWSQILHICFGAALALRYRHENNPYVYKGGFKILLDKDCEAKVLLCIDSKLENSYVYSFGVILLEVLYGRKLTNEDVNQYRCKIALNHEQLDDIIPPNLRTQMHTKSLSILSEIIYICLKEQPDQQPAYMFHPIVERVYKAFEIQWKHENLLWVKKFACLRIPLSHIKMATNDFAIKSQIYECLYKGELGHFDRGCVSTIEGENICESPVKEVIINRSYNYLKMPKEFFAEIEMLTYCKHPNLLSFLGFCDEDSEMILVFEGSCKETLNDYLRSESNMINLTWEQRIHICLDIAHGLNYVHNIEVESKPMTHHAIQSVNVFLDENRTAKIANIMLSKFDRYPTHLWDSKDEPKIPSHQTFDVVENMYSLGVILFEILIGRRLEFYESYMTGNDIGLESTARHLEETELMSMADPRIMEEAQYSHRFFEITYQCLAEKPTERPTLDVFIKSLEEALQIQLRLKKFAYLKIPLRQIKLATDNFAPTYLIKSHIYESVYKAELDHFDRGSVLTVEGENKGRVPKKTLIIKKIHKYQKTPIEFFSEIVMLTNCKHSNILSFIGFCDEDFEMILVFEGAFKETLFDYLRSGSNKTNFTWEQRIRICLDIAHGLKYLHNMECKLSMIRHVILNVDVFLDEKWTAKITTFRLSEFNSYSTSLEQSGQGLVMDTCYFLGVILFELLTGRLVYDPFAMVENVSELASMARRQLNEGKLKDIADPRIMEKTQECSYILREGPKRESLETFSEIAYQCLEKNPSKRPTLEFVIKSLEKASHFQVQNLEHLKIAFKDIHMATNNFDEKYCIGSGGYGKVYKGSMAIKMKSKDELPEMSNSTVAIKRIFNRDDHQGKEGFLAEIDVLGRCEHPNIVSLLGFCVEGNEMLLVYEHASNGSLDDYLGCTDKITNLTWAQRLKMCIDIANGLNYLHTTMEEKSKIIHRDIKSANILLSKNWEAKIADFGLSKFHPANQNASTINTKNIAGTYVYLDPEYAETGRLKKASDIYSFGVVLFEIFSGKLAYDLKYIIQNGNGLAPIAQRHYEKGTLKEILDPNLMDEDHELGSTLKVRPDLESLNAFSKIAYQCLAKSQADRPTIEGIIKELSKALKFQQNRKDIFKISLEDITLGVKDFSDDNCIIGGEHGMLYRGEVQYINGHKKVIVKRFHTSGPEHFFLRECEVLIKHKQENIIGLVGYCKELDEKIIVYENASNGCLSSYLNDCSFPWSTRLKICIDIANGLNFLHGGDAGQDVVIHRGIKSSNILLNKDWKAKNCGFENSLICSLNQGMEYVINDVGSPGYIDPLYWETRILTKESDIYSFGVILFEILCGRLACPEDFRDSNQFLDVLVKHHLQVDRVDEIVYEGIKEQIVLKSLVKFLDVAFRCLSENSEERPIADEVVVHLQNALEFQEAYEIWEAKLPRNYKEILQLSNCPKPYSTMTNKDIYNIFSQGILLQDDKLWFSIGDYGERNEMITSTLFSFRNRWSHRRRSINESRFHKVVEMSDISNLNIQIKKRTQLLPLNVKYSVHLVFKFCGPKKSHAKRVYVNLRYKMGNKSLHAYFATWREDDWMMIELCRFSNLKKDTNFEVLLEGFSRCYCDSRAIYIEGIEFRAIDNVKQENMEKLEETQQVLTSLSEMKKETYQMVSAEESVVCDVTNSKSPAQSRCSGEGIYKVPRQQVFCIKWHINEYQTMSPDTECACYLVFKLSENCHGLHCPVIVRDLFNKKSKDIIYFRSPSPWNLHDSDRVPKKRRDGWMEVIVSKFNSDSVLQKGYLKGNLKLISYEGTMFGLIIRGLEFRPMED